MLISGQKFTSIAASLALLGCMVSNLPSANAADMLGDTVEEYTEVEFGTGWYIRGDISLTTNGDFVSSDTSLPIPGSTTLAVTNRESQTLVGAGIAVGRKLSNNFRLDFGIESLGESSISSYSTTTNYRPPCSNAFRNTLQTDPLTGATIIVVVGGHTITNCIEESSSSYQLAQIGPNLFYDFDTTFLGAKPFVGIGLGVVSNTYTTETGTITCTAANEERCNPTDGGVADFGEVHTQIGNRDNGTAYHLSSSLSAGLTFPIAENLYLDSSYRYTHMFAEPVFGGNNSIANAAVPTNMHSVKIGLRYEIW